jgi:hypothetical protein
LPLIVWRDKQRGKVRIRLRWINSALAARA